MLAPSTVMPTGTELVGGLQIVRGTVADGAAAVDVEGIVDGVAHALGGLVLHQRRDDGRALAARDHGRR